MEPYIADLAHGTDRFVSAYPNAGLPDPLSPTGFPETPETFAPQLDAWVRNGWLNIVGGCCGTTPDHIRLIADAVKDLPPRRLPDIARYSRYSGMEALTVRPDSNFTLVGERTNITGSPKFSKLILAGEYDAALE